MFKKIISSAFILALFATPAAWSRPGAGPRPHPGPNHGVSHPHNNNPQNAKWQKSHSGPIDTKKENNLDANNDDKIDGVEKHHGKAHVNTQKEKNMDADNDGTVDQVEAQQSQSSNAQNPQQPLGKSPQGHGNVKQMSKVDQAWEKKADKDGNGWLDSTEANAVPVQDQLHH